MYCSSFHNKNVKYHYKVVVIVLQCGVKGIHLKTQYPSSPNLIHLVTGMKNEKCLTENFWR